MAAAVSPTKQKHARLRKMVTLLSAMTIGFTAVASANFWWSGKGDSGDYEYHEQNTGLYPSWSHTRQCSHEIGKEDFVNDVSCCRFSYDRNNLPVKDNDLSEFELRFSFWIGYGTAIHNPEGICISFPSEVLQDPDMVQLEGGLGYTDGWGVEIDACQNENSDDPEQDHIAYFADNIAQPRQTVELPQRLAGKILHFRMYSEGTTVKVTLDGELILTLENMDMRQYPYVAISACGGDINVRNAVLNEQLLFFGKLQDAWTENAPPKPSYTFYLG